MNAPGPLMPAMHADTIRACGVGFGAHHFLPAHMGSRPVVVVETTLDVTCDCCGHALAAGQRALRVSYCHDDRPRAEILYLHARHCSRAAARPAELALATERGPELELQAA